MLGSILLASCVLSSAPSKVASNAYLQQAFTSVTRFSAGLIKEADLGYDKDLSITAAWLEGRRSISFTKDLKSGTTYAFVAAGDEDAEDVDVKVTGPTGQIVDEDADDSSLAAAGFTAKTTGKYRFTITLASDVASYVGATLLSDDGWEVPMQNLNTAIADLVDTAESLDGTLVFSRAGGSFCLFGAVLPKGGTLKMTGVKIAGASPTVAGACDENSSDIDLLVTAGGRELGKDVEDDDFPVVGLSRPADSAEVTLTNAGAEATVAIFGLFHED